jgi:hypothetical protein
MPFSPQHNCLFIHIPKAGGTTIENLLGIHREWPALDLQVLHGALLLGDQEYRLQHLSLREASQFLPADLSTTCFTFTFVRNPWHRMVSEYFWRGGVECEQEFGLFVERACEIVKSRQELRGTKLPLPSAGRVLGCFVDRPIRGIPFRSHRCVD